MDNVKRYAVADHHIYATDGKAFSRETLMVLESDYDAIVSERNGFKRDAEQLRIEAEALYAERAEMRARIIDSERDIYDGDKELASLRMALERIGNEAGKHDIPHDIIATIRHIVREALSHTVQTPAGPTK